LLIKGILKGESQISEGKKPRFGKEKEYKNKR